MLNIFFHCNLDGNTPCNSNSYTLLFPIIYTSLFEQYNMLLLNKKYAIQSIYRLNGIVFAHILTKTHVFTTNVLYCAVRNVPENAFSVSAV